MSSDPIADMLTIIRNGGAVKKQEVNVPLSKVKLEILEILKRNKFIKDYKINDRVIEVSLKYYNGKFAIMYIQRISKPGVRRYSRAKNVPKSLSGYGITIVSTSYGLMTDKEARQKNLGGEVLCQVW